MARRRRNKIPQGIIEAKIESLSHDGRGICRVNDKVTFVDNALPGERVKFKYCYTRKTFDEAKAVEILEKSKDRIEAKCQYADLCGGCNLQHMSVEAAIAAKQQHLKEQLTQHAKVEVKEWLKPVLGQTLGYRKKARLGVKYVNKKGGTLVGFREKRNNYLADMHQCVVLHPSVGLKIDKLRNLIDQLSQPSSIPQIEVAVGDDQTALVFRHLEALTANDIKLLIDFAKEEHISIYLQSGGPDSINILWPKTNKNLSYSLDAFSLNYQFSSNDFIQVNAEVNQKMVSLAVELLATNKNDHVMDLFCGLGNFSLPLAMKSAAVTGVEGSDEMVKRAYQNARANNINNVSFIVADLYHEFSEQSFHNKKCDLLLLDPPRSGAEVIASNIKKLSPKRFVYVSCNPATLARDAAIICKQNYQLSKVGVLDMFPNTAHVESIALFSKI